MNDFCAKIANPNVILEVNRRNLEIELNCTSFLVGCNIQISRKKHVIIDCNLDIQIDLT